MLDPLSLPLSGVLPGWEQAPRSERAHDRRAARRGRRRGGRRRRARRARRRGRRLGATLLGANRRRDRTRRQGDDRRRAHAGGRRASATRSSRDGGALLCGPGGGRFVYDLRAKFDLFCKLVPLRPYPGCGARGRCGRRPSRTSTSSSSARTSAGSISASRASAGTRPPTEAHHRFRYDALQVDRILRVAMELARRRRGRLSVVVKRAGSLDQRALDERSRGAERGRRPGARAARGRQRLLPDRGRCARASTSSWRPTCSATWSATPPRCCWARGGSPTRRTSATRARRLPDGHGCAHDLAGTDRANPVGQIQALAMLLHESFGLRRAARRRSSGRSDACSPRAGAPPTSWSREPG